MTGFPFRPALLMTAMACTLAGCSVVPAPPVAPAPVAASPTDAAYLAGASNLTILANAARASGVADMLARPGPFTVFAPTDAAFARLAPGTVDALMRPDNRDTLIRLLTYHVVAGTLTAADLTARAIAGGERASLPSVEGDRLTLSMTQGHLTLTDGDGNRSYVETADVPRANGMVHVVNGVLVPRLDQPQRAAAASSDPRASTQDATPARVSRFQNGASVFNRSMQ